MPEPIVWILEDQLSPTLPALVAHPDAPVLMIESDRAFRQWPYHPKRLTFLISAMRHFADELRAAGRTVHYYPLQPKNYRDSLTAIRHVSKSTGCRQLMLVEPNDHHTRVWVDTLPKKLGVEIEIIEQTLFLTDRTEFADWARSLKSPVMEPFYRRMRKTYDVLMNGDKPVGGKWNFDKLNRKPPPGALMIPPAPSFTPDAITREVMTEVARRFADHYGKVDRFDLPVTRAEAQAAADEFFDKRLPLFGDYEDAMLTGQPVLYHSLLSMCINAGLLDPLELVREAERRYQEKRAPLNAVEGFVRQILGWREYMRGIYNTFMPQYRDRNARNDVGKLPDFFWTGDTDMNCLRQSIGHVVDHGYSHHIQRLMVICNYATLAGISPQEVNDWFLIMYIDSHDWVTTPNVVGMGMNADGGVCATKPYVSSGAYINRMSDYCGACKFNPAKKVGDDACPFNALYWTFMERNRKSLQSNPRMNMLLKNLDRMPAEELVAVRSRSEQVRKAHLR